ncbi:MAG: aminopeptidase P family protein [Deltaproteobacteria bacterium]|nr:MAG: aminopeptidase P family protein [Deltaproteobacteria bacterium]
MKEELQRRIQEFQRRIADENLDMAFIEDADNIYYLSGYWGYLAMDFGRPTVLIVPQSGSPTIITPGLEAEMARAMTWVGDIREWTDGVGGEWVAHLQDLLAGLKSKRIGILRNKTHPMILECLQREFPGAALVDISDTLGDMRMVKSSEEIAVMRQAGQVAIAMCQAGVKAIAEGVPEFEVALAVIAGGTRKAAEFLREDGPDRLFSPTIYNLQILQSGQELSMVHRRSTVRRIQRGDPVYMCFCGIANFKQFKLGFDREYFVGKVSDEHARLYGIALKAQAAALEMVRPGVPAEEVHAAALEVYQKAGFGICYRSGRGIGYSFLEKPEFKEGDKTPLQPGMTFAVDGAITIPGEFGARVGDSIVVTKTGFEYLTPYPKDLRIV